MKKYTSLALIGAIIAGITGFVSLDAISATPLMTMQGASDIHETGLMIGHVTYEVKGMDGQIRHYFQGDNFIVDQGTDCSAAAIFDSLDSICTGVGNFAYIAIGNATSPSAGLTDTALDTSGGGSPAFGAGGGDEMARSARIDAVITPANSVAVPDPLHTVVTIATPPTTPFTFTDLGSAGTIVTQSGLFDQGTLGGHMFSIKDVNGLIGLPVTKTDTLSVTWTITLS